MIAGRVTTELEAVIHLRVQAIEGQAETVELVIDTGFTGFLALPSERVAALGLPFLGESRATLADGSPADVGVYEAVVHWHKEPLLVPVLAVQGGALVGMALLRGSHLGMDVVEDGSLRIATIG